MLHGCALGGHKPTYRMERLIHVLNDVKLPDSRCSSSTVYQAYPDFEILFLINTNLCRMIQTARLSQ